MNKTAIQKFAIWARTELIEQVAQRAYQYGIDAEGYGDASADSIGGRLLTAEEKAQRRELIQQIDAKGYEQVMEEVAYTWFNRFIALRFMEVNNYLPSHIRVFSDASGAFKPEILSDVLHLELPGLDTGKVAEYIESNDTEGLYRYLLLTQCNALNESLPRMFERMGGYTEMLLPNNILKPDSVLGRMVTDIPEEDWQDAVQIIGWLYQYYNTELKDDTFARLKKNVKITKERIPAATQLFTPDWIVRYMVENSLGRLWVEGHPNDALKSGWKYYLDEAKQEPEVEAQLTKLRAEYAAIKPEEIKVIDPCMGSGHILVYAFDVLMQIYTSAGWSEREAAQSILKNNLYGLDIDDRAAQLAYFAVMMKARQYDRRLLTRGIQPNVYAIHESNHIPSMAIEYFHQGDARLKTDIERLVAAMRDAKEYGSILSVAPVDFARLYIRFDEIRDEIHMLQPVVMDELLPMVQCAELLAQKYDVVVTNPPYMGGSMNRILYLYISEHYPLSKSDLFAVFIERCCNICRLNGILAMVTPESWMFLSSYCELRKKLLGVLNICALAELGVGAFDSGFGTVAFSLRKSKWSRFKGCYIDLRQWSDKKGSFALASRYTPTNDFFRILPDHVIAYWCSSKMAKLLQYPPIEKYYTLESGVVTGNNVSFLRLWFEVSATKTALYNASLETMENGSKRWFKCNKGGGYHKWYGNYEYIIDLGNDANNIRQSVDSSIYRLRQKCNYFLEGINWPLIGVNKFSAKYTPYDVINNKAANSIHFGSDVDYCLLAYMNCNIYNAVLNMINPTVNYPLVNIANSPSYSCADKMKTLIKNYALECVEMARRDWDAYETSWDFKRNPLV